MTSDMDILKKEKAVEIKTECRNIEELEVKCKIVTETEKGEVVDRYPVTVVKFEVRGTPGQFDDLLRAVAAEHLIHASFGTEQLSFGIKEVVKTNA